MKTVRLLHPWVGCALCCALAGCSTTPKSNVCCQTCAPTLAAGPLPPNYENYTPPSAILAPIPPSPASDVPAPPDIAPPPPVESRLTPSKVRDFFEATGQNAPQRFN